MNRTEPPPSVILSGLFLFALILYWFVVTPVMALAIWQPSFAEVVLVAIIGLCLMVWNVALLGGKNWARQLFVVGLPLVFGIGMLEEGFFRVVCLFLAGIYVCLVPALLGSASTSYFGGPVWRRRNNGAGERGQSP